MIELRVFHYTVGVRLVKIVEDREIKLARANIAPGEKPVVWFTTKTSWEETCNKAVIRNGRVIDLDQRETETAGKGLFRIEVDPKTAPYTWREYKNLSGVDRGVASGLYKIGQRNGARPEIEWRVSFNSVGMEHWLCIEKWNGERWERVTETKGGESD